VCRSSPLIVSPLVFAKLLELLEQTRDFAAMLDVSLSSFSYDNSQLSSSPIRLSPGSPQQLLLLVLEPADDVSLLPQILDAFQHHALIWNSMQTTRSIAEALFEKHLALRQKAAQRQDVLAALAGFVRRGCLDEEDARIVLYDCSVIEKVSPKPNVGLSTEKFR
jgi:hypothetical protein